MKSAIHCQLLLPGILLEPGVRHDGVPALNTMLRHASHLASFAGDRDAWLCRFFGVERQHDWPIAPFSCLGEGLDPGTAYWLCADPVHLHLQRDRFSLDDSASKALTQEQSRQLTDTLNEHFAADGMRFSAPCADRWYLCLAKPPVLQTRSLSAAIGQHDLHQMFQGSDALQWRGRLNEIQMLLHDHPVNLELEKRGALPVNSIWLWGGGVLPSHMEPNNTAVWEDDSFTRGLAIAHGALVARLPASARELLESGLQQSTQLIVPGWLEPERRGGDPKKLFEALQWQDSLWFAPLLQSLWHGRVARISLHFATAQRVEGYSLTRADLWKFWRCFRSVEACVG